MRLPESLKALKFVAQGQSFGVARQNVRDRRLAKSLVQADCRTIQQEVDDFRVALKLGTNNGQEGLGQQRALLKQANANKLAGVQLQGAPSTSGTSPGRAGASAASTPALTPSSGRSSSPSPSTPRTPARMSWDDYFGIAPQSRSSAAAPPAYSARPSIAPAPSMAARGPQSGLFAQPSPLRRSGALRIARPTARLAAASGAASEATVRPELIRGDSDPDVGGFKPMHAREGWAEV